MSQNAKVAVMFGGSSAEREVSLRSGKAVLASLLDAGVNAFAFDPQQEDLSSLDADKVFIVLHGRGGEDGVMQGALEQRGLPYTGSGVLGSALAMDKIRCKWLFQAQGLPTAAFAVARPGTEDYAAMLAELGGKVMVKPANEGSSIGMSVAVTAEELAQAIATAHQYDEEVLVERWIEGREFTIAILNGAVLPIVEMRTPRSFYDYEAKYQANSTEYLCPAPLTAELTQAMQKTALAAFQAVGASGWGRVDLMLDQQGQFYLLEVNTVPGMTEKSLVPMAAKAAGYSFQQLVLAILTQAESARR
ncbi:D-alanine--D-alanine ligase [Alishewanella sp. SMS8]|uniref:D-alanine--D-alanine ligase n=1 Tax=Alishewanella sp. SMS8 TaxID=2994676 RepID=UPI0027403A72|nr:D-alanine--D-alanine ligase [Alishewanella sp. SMS8]MDP4944876.1 D-alanine--D-alanine ligase [Alishewanella sp.]MDP5206383.1 D-alanine--D-alanine ligase [Alishewanella sp. SMS9]MDP5036477.1 D-alanine--D-alanine ligase [Alishewanella sp.]MDP5187375.1 D-alanine--D-alanine ligase [Alishewanella sp.]MDP5458923.1 D-alanine--D-alanine ligase [Alishewanella sp. SMS8]